MFICCRVCYFCFLEQAGPKFPFVGFQEIDSACCASHPLYFWCCRASQPSAFPPGPIGSGCWKTQFWLGRFHSALVSRCEVKWVWVTMEVITCGVPGNVRMLRTQNQPKCIKTEVSHLNHLCGCCLPVIAMVTQIIMDSQQGFLGAAQKVHETGSLPEGRFYAVTLKIRLIVLRRTSGSLSVCGLKYKTCYSCFWLQAISSKMGLGIIPGFTSEKAVLGLPTNTKNISQMPGHIRGVFQGKPPHLRRLVKKKSLKETQHLTRT